MTYHGHGWFHERCHWFPDHDTLFKESWHLPPAPPASQLNWGTFEYHYRPEPVTANACVPGAAVSIEPDVLRHIAAWELSEDQADWLRTEVHRAIVFFGVVRARALLRRDPNYLHAYPTILVDAPPPVKVRMTPPKPKRAAPEPVEHVPPYLGGTINPAWRSPGRQGGHILPAGEPLPADWAAVAGSREVR